jgi:xanthine dehydrogenase YagR molybdenum-binding subunit
MPWPANRRLIGTKVQRLDGPYKATGRAKYSFDINRPNMLHARILRSPHAHARIKNLDTSAAEKVAGFRALHQIVKPGAELIWAGEEILAIAADTEEHAEDAIRAVKIDYEVLPHLVKEEDALRTPAPAGTVGNKPNVFTAHQSATNNFATQAYEGTAPALEGRYSVPVICHQCLESHGLIAEWDKEQTTLTVYASTQNVNGLPAQLAGPFKIPANRVKCVTHYMGGGFGSKFNPGPEGLAAAHLARITRAPVKLMLDRAEEVTVGGQRPSAGGTVKIAATKEGVLRAYEVDCHGSPGVGGGSTVNFQVLPYVYRNIPNLNYKLRVQTVRLNFQTARAMRAPGHPQNCVLTDQPLDDLAARLNINPLEFRLRNLPPNDAAAMKNAPTSYNALRHTIYTREIEIARKLSEWDKKWHPPGRDKGVIKHGMGMGLHTWGGGGGPQNDMKATISADGSVLVQSSTQDLGTAERTVLAIVAAEVLGLNPTDITVEIGESPYGRSTPSGGSTTCPGTAPAILNAVTAARDALFTAIAPRLNAQPGDLVIEVGQVRNRANNTTMPWRQACSRLGTNTAVGNGNWTAGLSSQGVGGVQIAEVKVDTETGVVRCTKVVAVQDCGLIINKLGCESQVAGGVIMGVNYALFEEAIFDRHTGRQVNPDMEFYKLGGIQDMPQIVVHMMDMPERGVIGIGEPPTISTCAAVGNAVFNAIGVRVPNAPFTPEHVLAALATRKGNN